jgi:hypothetical protein
MYIRINTHINLSKTVHKNIVNAAAFSSTKKVVLGAFCDL